MIIFLTSRLLFFFLPFLLSGFQQESSTSNGPAAEEETLTNIRRFLLSEDFYLATSLGHAVTKLVLQLGDLPKVPPARWNQQSARAVYLLAGILRLGQVAGRKAAAARKQIAGGDALATGAPGGGSEGQDPEIRELQQQVGPLDLDNYHHIVMCIRILMNPEPRLRKLFLGKSKEVLTRLLQQQEQEQSSSPDQASIAGHLKKVATDLEDRVSVDSVLDLRQLKGAGFSGEETAYAIEDDEGDIQKAIGLSGLAKRAESTGNRIYQLTGFGDPVYAEAQLTVIDFNISLDILVVNQTESTLQNVTVELYTSGDLRLIERPQAASIPAFGAMRCRAAVKVSCTESGVIFGTISWDSASGQNKTLVTCNNIHMDVMDYIQPAYTSESQFRSMWAEFIWENKVAVATEITDPETFLKHIMSITNMANLTPEATLVGDSNFLAANLYARSLFGEDALLNLSIEKQTGPDGKPRIGGYMRIRSKTQGIALSLGDKLLAKQRTLE